MGDPRTEVPLHLSGATRLDDSTAKHAGFEDAYVAHRSAIYNHVLRMVGSEADAEDLTVAAFEKALRAWDRRPPMEEMRPWMFRIATNCCLDELRRRKRIEWRPWETFLGLFHPSQVAPDDPEKEVIRGEKADLVHSALAQLSARDRSALIMRECYGMSNEEVGQAFNTTRDGAKMMLFRAREKLRSAYLQVGGEMPEGARIPASGASSAARRSGPVEGDTVVGDSK